MNKFYITTPIYYVNDEPHIGHAYTTILADVLGRIKKLQDFDVFFLTGTDEHGQKVQEAAKKRGVEPLDHVNEYVKRFESIWEKLNIEYNDFIRTTENRHKDRVKDILIYLKEKGDIYLDEYKGMYSVSEERFITEKEADSGNFKEIKILKEKNYFFKMSKYQKQLINHIKNNPDFIKPTSRKNEILGFLDKELTDLCISRPKSRLSWGIELPFDKDYVSYVWFDALLNYITAIGWGTNEGKFNNYWPADYHLMGKDIITTHAVYWPTMLMACDLKLPKTIFAHGWWLTEEEKMSKSTGNVIKPLDLTKQYGVDALRYYLMRNMVLGQDASYSFESFKDRYNADLANDYGNLVNRVLILIYKNFDQKIPNTGEYNTIDLELISSVKQLPNQIIKYYNELKIHDAIENIMKIFRILNKYLEMKAPWKAIKEDEQGKLSAANTLYISADLLKIGSILINPIIPEKSNKVLELLGTELNYDLTIGNLKSGTQISKPDNLFPRIEDAI